MVYSVPYKFFVPCVTYVSVLEDIKNLIFQGSVVAL